MRPQTAAVSSLRAVSFRISSASKNELPHVVACVAPTLLSCKEILSAPDSLAQKDNDAALVLQRFHTQLSTLLNDRTIEGRWAATVLIKATIEAGGWETLRKANAWVRGLLTNLKKPDPPIAKCLAIITLTRIFMTTWDYPTLVREITTPALPTFIGTCLANVASRPQSMDELKATLESFALLLPRHPTIFRSHQAGISQVLATILQGSTGLEGKVTTDVSGDLKDVACRVSVLLHQCEPKGAAGQKWEQSLVETIRSTHAAADRTFVAVEESWQSVAGVTINKRVLGDDYSRSQEANSASDSPALRFVYDGSGSLLGLLHLLANHFAVGTTGQVGSSIGAVTDLVTRLFAVIASRTSSKNTIKYVQGVSRDEKEALFEVLSLIHSAAMELVCMLLDRYSKTMLPITQPLLDQLLWIFSTGSGDINTRTACYALARRIITIAGPTMSKQTVSSMRKLIAACCDDLLPTPNDSNTQQPGATSTKTTTSMNADTFLKQSSQASTTTPTSYPGLKAAAHALLPCLLTNIPADSIPVALRTQIDRTAILTQHTSVTTASVLNTPSSSTKVTSLLPLLARAHPSHPSVEALLRPRISIIQTGTRRHPSDNDDDALEIDSPEHDMHDNDDAGDEDKIARTPRASFSPEPSTTTDRQTQAIAHAEQDLVDEALTTYLEAKAAGKGLDGAEEEEEAGEEMEDVVAGDEETRLPSEAVELKRSREGDAGEEEERGEKRMKGEVVAPVESGAATLQMDSDDEDFVVPPLVLGGDSDEDEDED